jgi:hypothetical protein
MIPVFKAIALIMAVFSMIQCQSVEQREGTKEKNAKQKGHPTFLIIKVFQEKSTKQISAELRLKNLSDIEKIKNVKLLLFAYDKNGLVQIPESQKTPEILCQWKQAILPNQSAFCTIGLTSFLNEIQEIKVHSLSLSGENGNRYLVNDRDLDEIIEMY